MQDRLKWGAELRLPAGKCLGLAVPPHAHLHQPLVSRACPRASGHAGPGLPWGVLPGRGSLWEGGLKAGRGGEGQGRVRTPGWRPSTRSAARDRLQHSQGLRCLFCAMEGGPRAPSTQNILQWGF